MNNNKHIRSRADFWDAKLPEIRRLVINEGVMRIKPIAKMYGVSEGSVASALHKRGYSMNGLREERRKKIMSEVV